MVMVYITQCGEEKYMDGYMVSNLDDLKKAVALKWDGVILYTGNEGDGKTTKCSQDLAYLDPTFNLDRVCFTLAQVKEVVKTLKPGQAVQYDESRKDTNASDNIAAQREFIRIMTENRNKRLYWGIVSATFFDLKKYFAIHRTRLLINVYSNGLERGFFSFYGREEKKDLYIKGKKEWNWHVVKPNFRGRFTSWLPFDEAAYEAKKHASTIGNEKEGLDDIKNDPVFKREVAKKVVAFMNWVERNQWGKFKWGVLGPTAKFLGISSDSLTVYKNDYLFNQKQDGLESDKSVQDADFQAESLRQVDFPAGVGQERDYVLVETVVRDKKDEELTED